MTDFHGRFCWYELMAEDCDAARAFYGTVMGWSAQPAPAAPERDYWLFAAEGHPVAGLLDLPDTCRQAGIPSGWTGYVAVRDVDATAALAEGLGGTIRVPGTDIPEVGRFAVITDPQGARLGLFHPAGAPDHPAGQDQPGGIRWRELATADWPAAFAFYQQLFGWEKAEAFDMGEAGQYQLFKLGETAMGGMFSKPSAPPAWLFYFDVPDIDAAAERAAAAGARITDGPTAVPGGGWIIQATDPQGAAFALHGGRAAVPG